MNIRIIQACLLIALLGKLFLTNFNTLTLSRWHKTSIILLWLTTDEFTRQGENSRLERVIVDFIFSLADLILHDHFSCGN